MSPNRFRLVRDPEKNTTWAQPVSSHSVAERRGTDWQGLAVEGTYWGDILLKAKADGLVVLKDIDVCTAWCAKAAKLRVVSMTEPGGRASGYFIPSRSLWAALCEADWTKKYLVPFFELVEKNEMPDMSLLEWLVVMGGISPAIARAGLMRYKRSRSGDGILLYGLDCTRLLSAAKAREEVLAEQKIAAEPMPEMPRVSEEGL